MRYEELLNKPKPKRDWRFISEVAGLLLLILAAYALVIHLLRDRRASELEFRASVQEELMLLRRDVDANTKVLEELAGVVDSNTVELDKIDSVRKVLEEEMLQYVNEGVSPPQIFTELYAKTLEVQQPGK